MEQYPHLNELLKQSMTDNSERQALTDLDGVSFSYKDVSRKIEKLHILFKHSGVEPGDKVALCGRNSAQWAVAFFGILTYGAVAVPVLHEFKPDNVHHIINHSEAKLLFVETAVWENLDPDSMTRLSGALRMSDFSLLMSRSKALDEARLKLNEFFGCKFPERYVPSNLEIFVPGLDDLALINYTSGSTGLSKGVMLTYRNLCSNYIFCSEHINFLEAGDSIVSMLPMAHMYGLMVDVIFPFIRGCHINFLTRTPSPRVIKTAFEQVKPKMIVAVPLIIEKMIKGNVFPLLEKPLMKILLKVPFVDDRLLGKIKDKLYETFGGNLKELIIGGAALNKDVEAFLHRIDFPFTVGYGMTECAPLISYASAADYKPGSCGRIVDRMEVKVASPEASRVAGVIYVRGQNVMKGYYRNPAATEEVLDIDGWLNTGDIGTVDDDGFIFLRGRNKNMILGPSGQNIYPEEIEEILNNLPYVGESIVISDGGKLVALVYPDYDNAARENLDEMALAQKMDENLEALNQAVPAYSKVSRIKMMNEEFEKTPKRSIKRYLYQHAD